MATYYGTYGDDFYSSLPLRLNINSIVGLSSQEVGEDVDVEEDFVHRST